jgi:Mor family transcriptional regulator
MSFPTNQLRDFSSLFSRSEVYRWLKNDFESINIKLKRYSLFEKNQGNSYLDILKKTYKLLEKHYPNEYIIKNEFLNQWLKKELGNNNSVIFNELRIGKAIADLAMFNGVSKVFEIKTILDKEYRLSSQLQEYKKLFNEIYIIVPKVQLSKYLEYDKHIGVITYDSDFKRFDLVQKSILNNAIDKSALMEVLHTKEYLKITKSYYSELPEMSTFTQFEICKKLIANIPNKTLNKLFLEVMKERKINNLFFNKVNSEFNQICLSLNLKITERDSLINKLKTNTV